MFRQAQHERGEIFRIPVRPELVEGNERQGAACLVSSKINFKKYSAPSRQSWVHFLVELRLMKRHSKS